MQFEARPIVLGGHIVHVGDRVIVRAPTHNGREGNFRGITRDGRLVVRVKFGGYSQTLLRCEEYEVERSNK